MIFYLLSKKALCRIIMNYDHNNSIVIPGRYIVMSDEIWYAIMRAMLRTEYRRYNTCTQLGNACQFELLHAAMLDISNKVEMDYYGNYLYFNIII